MSNLRTAAQQALEALEATHYAMIDAGLLDQDRLNKNFTAHEALKAALAEPQPSTLHGWVFKRNADGSIGIFAPPPKPGESQRTSDCVGPQDRDLHELLGKLADHMAALAEPVQEPVAWRTFDGEGGYDYRTYEDNEDYAAEWAKRNPRHVGWVEPVYTAPPQRPVGTVQEPVAWMVYTLDGKSVCVTDNPADFTDEHRVLPLYTAPPQRKPLTEEEIRAIMRSLGWDGEAPSDLLFARAVEAAHGIGGQP